MKKLVLFGVVLSLAFGTRAQGAEGEKATSDNGT